MSKYEIAAAAAVRELEGQWIRMSNQEQREVFGAALLGKVEIQIDLNGQGKVSARKRAAHSFGGDMVWNEWSLDEVAEAVKTGRKLRVG